MGRMLLVTVGYGIVLPWGEDEEFDFSNEFYTPFKDEEEDDAPDLWDVLEEVVRRFPFLEHESATLNDYQGDYALLLKYPITRGWDTKIFNPNIGRTVNVEYVNQLEQAAELLGVPFNPSWLVVPSYG